MKRIFITTIFLLIFIPSIGNSQINTNRAGNDCGAASNSICNPAQIDSPAEDVPGFLIYTLQFVGGLIGFISIATLVYGGFRLVTANGNDSTITESKNTITYTVIGFILSIMAYAGVLAIEDLIGVKTIEPNKNNTPFNPFGDGVTLQNFAQSLLQGVIILSGLVALLMLIINGYRYVTARGDDKQVSKAKIGILWSLVGLVIILFAYVIIRAVANLLGK